MHRDSNKKPGVERSPPRRRRSPANRESFYCSYCKCQLLTKHLLEEHNRSPVHKQKKILIEKAISDGLQFCYSCEKIFPSKIELDAHCLMSRHQPLYRVEEMHEFRKRKEEDNVETVMPYPSNEAEKRRMKESKERKDIVSKLNKMKENDPDQVEIDLSFQARNAVYCKVCNVDCMNASNFKIHIDSWRHRAEMEKRDLVDNKIKETSIVKETEIKQQKGNVPTNLISVMQYFCEVCSAPCTSEENYLSHCRGKKHLRKISSMQRPYKCYTCHEDFNSEKPYSIHLESRSHMEKAFKNRNKDALKTNVSNEEWIEKRDKGIESEQKKDHQRRTYKDDRRKSIERHTDERMMSKDERRDKVEKSSYSTSRKIDISSSASQENIVDLREKLKGKSPLVAQPLKVDVPPSNNVIIADHIDMNKRAIEKELEAKFKKLSQEYENNLAALRVRLTMEREEDIATYQRLENTYKRLCEDEDFIREDLRVMQDSDPRKEDYIRDMIRIQDDMREVRQQLEFREMMIIKRESLFRLKFPNADNKVILNKNDNDSLMYQQVNNYTDDVQLTKSNTNVNPVLSGPSKESDDLRLELERERLLKRLGPELEAIDPLIREKLLSVILNKDVSQIDKPSLTQSSMKSTMKDDKISLTEREKQLESELEKLRTKTAPVVTERKRITKSLVPYEDEDEKAVKKPNRDRSSSNSRNSSDSEDSKHAKKRHRKKSPMSRNRGRTKRSRSADSEEMRKKRKRSRSRERKRKSSGRKNDDRKRSSDKRKEEKKPIKMKLQARQTQNMIKSANPLPDDSNSEDEKTNNIQSQPTSIIPVIGSKNIPLHQVLQPPYGGNVPIIHNIQQVGMHNPQQAQSMLNSQQVATMRNPHEQQVNVRPNQVPSQPRREQFSLWNRAAAPSKQSIDSPKEDVWDIAFSGNQLKEKEMNEISNIFSASAEIPRQLPTEILDILRNVAPMLKNMSSPNTQPEQSGHKLRQKVEPQSKTQKHTQEQEESFTNKPLQTMVSQESVTSAGGKVRSILKKIKDPVPAMSGERREEETKTVPTLIPGLELSGTDIKRDIIKVDSQPRGFANEMHSQDVNEGSAYLHENYSNISRNQRDLGINSRDNRDNNKYRSQAFSSSMNINDNVERYNSGPNFRKNDMDIIDPSSGSLHMPSGRHLDSYPLHEESKRGNNEYEPHYGESRDPYLDVNPIPQSKSTNILENKRLDNFQRDNYSRYPDNFTPPHQDRWVPSREVSWIRDNLRQPPVDNFLISGRDDPRNLAPRIEPKWIPRDDQRLLPPIEDGRNIPRGYEEPLKDYYPQERLPHLDDRLPIRRDGESEDQFYERFERFYAMKRESERDGVKFPPPPPGPVIHDPRNLPDPRAMARDDFFRRREQNIHPEDRYLHSAPPAFVDRVDDSRRGRPFADYDDVKAPLKDERQPIDGDRRIPPKEFNQYDNRRPLNKELDSFPASQRVMDNQRPAEEVPVKLPHELRNEGDRRNHGADPVRVPPSNHNNQRGPPVDPYAPKQAPPPRRPFNKPNY
ncbi:uncharacterized protein LOC100204642 [Hydra vulgaris]|uniref:Uncharacterized protein LOC100204642 n=1 Tax=Hydra vulgaris TaxID=6087 RepID=A0ABM4DKY1_HYDVU